MPSSDPRGARLLAILRVFCLVLIGMHLFTPYLAEEQAWGLWPFTYFPLIWRWLLAGSAALLCVPGVTGHVTAFMGRTLDAVSNALAAAFQGLSLSPSTARHLLFLGLAILSLIPFYLFRIVHTRWGDAYILVNGIAFPDPALRLTATWQAPLDLWLHARLWQLGNKLFSWSDAWPVYRLLSPLAGAVFVYGLLRLADGIGRNRTEKLLIVGLMGTLGTLQLFFGYAENYSLAAVGVLLYLWLALEAMEGRRTLWQPALALAVTNGLHPSTIVLDPTLLFVAWMWVRRQGEGRTERRGEVIKAVVQVAVPMMAVAGGVIALMALSGHGLDVLATTDRPGGGDARWFVPLNQVSTRWERYTMFSWPHLREFLNEQVLTAPVTLGGLIIVGGWLGLTQRHNSRKADDADDIRNGHLSQLPVTGQSKPPTSSNLTPPADKTWTEEIIFLTLCAVLYLLFVWAWNPDYGGQRDWDLFSLAALPSTLLLARLLPRALPDRGQLARAGLMLTAASAMHTAAWIYQNTLPWQWT